MGQCKFPCHTDSSILLTEYLQYFGTMAGVRGFNDPNVQINPDGNSVWHQ